MLAHEKWGQSGILYMLKYIQSLTSQNKKEVAVQDKKLMNNVLLQHCLLDYLLLKDFWALFATPFDHKRINCLALTSPVIL